MPLGRQSQRRRQHAGISIFSCWSLDSVNGPSKPDIALPLPDGKFRSEVNHNTPEDFEKMSA